MFHNLLTMTLLVFCGFLVFYAVFLPVTKKYMQNSEESFYMLPFPYILLFYAIGCGVIYYLSDQSDFIVPLNLWRAFLPILLSGIIYIASIFFEKNIFKVVVLASVSALVIGYPVEEGFAYLPLNPICTKSILIIWGTIFCLCYPLMSTTVHTFTVPSVLTLIGVCVLSFLGGAPLYSALCAALLAGLLLAYMAPNFYNEKIVFDDGASTSIAFLICSILFLQLGEFSFPSCLIFTSVFMAELLFSVWNRFSVNHTGSLLENTCYYSAAQIRTPYVLSMDICKIGAIGLFFGWFQMSAVNSYSVFVVAVIITLWLNSSIAKNPRKQSIREINQNFVDDIKQNISETKEVLKKIKNRNNDGD